MSNLQLPSCLLDVEDLAKLLRLSKATIHRYKAEGRLPKVCSGSHKLRWRSDEIQAWLTADCPDQKTWEQILRTACKS